ncbi:MAG: 3-dehydroquinate synthase [Bacillota bacterium]
MKELTLKGQKNISRILIGKGILKQTAELLGKYRFEWKKPSRICVITDSNVEKLYLENLEIELQKLDIPIFHHIIPAGEENKNLETVSQIYDTLSNQQFDREDMIIALGGGVTGDIAGFAAATYLRGIRHLVQIPTTLLAQVDSSVGGKTGVDLPQGKNLVGAFRQPDLVLIDPEVLETLPESIFTAGIAEVIKYGCIWDKEILNTVLEPDYKNQLEELIEKCVVIKIKVVEEDETEEGLRRILNFGHTIGHGVEKLGNFNDLSHGEAVSVGLAAAARMGESIGITRKGCYEELLSILKAFDLPTKISYPLEEVYEAMLSDKKKQGESINFIFIEDFGKTRIEKIPVLELKKIMKVLGD